jgi:hypothetical protein
LKELCDWIIIQRNSGITIIIMIIIIIITIKIPERYGAIVGGGGGSNIVAFPHDLTSKPGFATAKHEFFFALFVFGL